jgi:hypothetical protein
LSCLALPCPALPCSSVCAAAAAPAAQKKGWAKPSRTRKPKGSVRIAYPSVAEDCQRPIANLILYNLTARRAVRDAFPALPFSFSLPLSLPSALYSRAAPSFVLRARSLRLVSAECAWQVEGADPICGFIYLRTHATARRPGETNSSGYTRTQVATQAKPSQVKLVGQSRRGQARTHPVGCLSVCLSRRLRLRRWA